MTYVCKDHGVVLEVTPRGRVLRVQLGNPAARPAGRCALMLHPKPRPGALSADGRGPCEVVQV